MFTSTIASYPQRGHGGDARYHGNCSPLFIRDFLLTFNKSAGLVIDPMEGGKTTRDVCAELGMPYTGFDLRDGFDARVTRLRDHIDRPASSIVMHPPYMGMVRYDHLRGAQHDERDLSSHGTDWQKFCEEFQQVAFNAYDALEVDGHYMVLLGLWRDKQTGELIHIPARIFPYLPGRFQNEIIKAQHNTRSGNVAYGAKEYVMTTHEVAFIFKKTATSLSGYVHQALSAAESLERGVWYNLVRYLALKGREVKSTTIYEALANHPQTKNNPTYKATIRQKLNELVREGTLQRLAPGHYVAA